jgi:hypothetical protein
MSLLPPPEAIYPDSANRFATILVEMHLARLFGRRLPRNRCRTVDDLPLRTVRQFSAASEIRWYWGRINKPYLVRRYVCMELAGSCPAVAPHLGEVICFRGTVRVDPARDAKTSSNKRD